ncbi:MAG: CARDB domain-containing protein [Phycisphaerae bacterium]
MFWLSDPTLGSQLHLNRSTGGDQTEVAVDADSSGNYVAVWQGTNAEGWGTNDIYFQRFNAEGTPLGPEFRVNPDWVGEQSQPDLAVADDGRFVVTWTGDNDGSSSGVYTHIFAADGSPLTDAFRVNTYTTGNQSDSEVAVNVVTGDFVVAWQSDGQDGSSWGVYGQRFNAAGTALGGEFRVNTYTSDQQCNPVVVMDGDGDFVVVWQSLNQDGSSWGVYGQRYDSAGVAQGGEFRANTYTSDQQAEPAVAMDVDGNFIIGWQSNKQDGSSWGVYGQRYNAAGTALGSEFRVNTYTNSQQTNPAVAVDVSGEFAVTWQSANQDGSSWGVYGQRYAANGSAVGGEFRANTYTNNEQRTSAVAYGVGGDLLIAWQSYPSDEEGSSWGIFGQLYGSGLSQADMVPVRVTAPAGANLGQTINVSAEIRNQGSADAGPFTCQYYLSADATITTADTPLGGQFTVGGLNAYTTYTDSRQIQVPLDAPTGEWFVGLLMDVNLQVAEADEANNGTATVHLQTMDVRSPAAPLGSQLHVNHSTGGDQTEVAVDADSSGNYVAVWQGANAEGWGTNDIYFQRLNAEGTPLGPEFRVNPDWVGEQSQPDVAVADNGRFVVTWTGDNDGSSYGVYGRIFAADGSPLTDAFLVNTYTTGNQSDSEVAVNVVTGDFVVAWQSEGQDESSWGVYGQRYAADGTRQGSEFRANTYTNDQQCNPVVAMDADGEFVVSWQSHGQDGSSWGVYGQRYTADGTAAGGEFRVNNYTSSEQRDPVVAMDADGDLVIGWHSYGQDGSGWGVYGQRYNYAGMAQGVEFLVNTYISSDQYGPALAMDADGDFVFTWQSNGQDGSSNGVYAQEYASDGSTQGGEFRANTYTYYEQNTSAVAFGAGGDLLIAWQSYPSDEEGWSCGIFGQVYGSGLSQADLVPVRVTAPTGANLGQTISVSAEIRNQGSVDAGPFTCQYYLSADAVITTADTPLGGQFTVGGVGAYQTYSDSRALAVPNVAVGDWYVGIIVDTANEVAEADETNNVYRTSYNEPVVDIAALPLLGPEFRVNTTTADNQSAQVVGLDSVGNSVVIWHSQGQDGSGLGIYGQRYDAAGSPVGSEFRVNATTSADQTAPALAVASDGRFVVTWHSQNQDGSGWGVYARLYGADGQALAGEFRVNTYTYSDQSDPSVAMDGAGNFIIVWRSAGQDAGNNGGIFGQRYLADGTPNGPEFWVCSNAAPDQYRPVVTMNAAGQFVVAWDNGDNTYARRFLANGTAADDEFVVNSYASDQQNCPSAAIDADGNFMVAWRSNGQDGNSWGVYAQRFAANGERLGEEFRVNTYTSGEQRDPSVDMDADGNFVIAWHSYGQDGDNWAVLARRYAADGSPVGSEFRVNSYTSNAQSDPSVVVRDLDRFTIVWQSAGQDGSSYGVYSRQFGLSNVDGQPNFVVSQISGPGSVYPGEAAALNVTIRNTGMTITPASTARLWLSDDNVYGNADDLDTGIQLSVPSILSEPGSNSYSTIVNYTWPEVDPFGTDRDYYFILQADSTSAVVETNETDNVGVSNVAELRLPDLSGWVDVPSSILPGQDVSIVVNIRNLGDAQAGASTAHLWLSDDSTIGNADDLDLHIDIPIPTIRTYNWPDYSYQTYQTTVQYAWPEPDPYGTDGQYFFVLRMDVTNAVVEASETNNYDLSNSFGVNRPNLVVNSLSGPTEVQPGQSVTYSLEVRNTGTAAAGASVLHLWLSDDATGGNADDHDLLVDVPVPALATYTSQNNYPKFQTNVTFTWPATDPFGTDLQYHVLAKADAAGQVAEGNEDDNYLASSPVYMLVPDLEFVALRTATTVQAGQQLSVHLDVRNAGRQAVPASTAHLWLSDNDILGDSDDRELTVPLDISVPEIAGSETWSSDITIPWPLVDPFGTDGEYFLAVRLDAGNQVAEGNETNNTGMSSPLALVAPMDLEMDLVGHIGGASLAVAVQGDYAYELTTAGLRVLDVRDPTDIHKVSEVVFSVTVPELTDGRQQTVSIFAGGDRLYVVDGTSTRIFDLSVPYQPVLLAEHEADVAVLTIQGRIAFIGDGEDPQLDIVDLSDPANPQVLAEYDLRGEARGLAVQGSLAYVTSNDPVFHRAAIEVVNLADLSDPAFVSRRALDAELAGSATISGNLLAVAVYDDYYYYEESHHSIVLLDVSAPTLPRVRGQCEPGGSVETLDLSGTTLFVAGWTWDEDEDDVDFLTVIDVADPADPAMIGAVTLGDHYLSPDQDYYAPAGNRTNLVMLGSHLYFANGDLDVVDVSNRFAPTVVVTRSEPYDMNRIAMAGSIACVARGQTLELIDVSEPSLPRLVGTYQSSFVTYYPIDYVLATGTRVFLAQGNRLEIVDVSNPARPHLLASHQLPIEYERPLDVKVRGGLMYVLDGSYYSYGRGKLHVIDVSDPADLDVLSSIDLFLYAERRYAYYEGQAYEVGYTTAHLAVQGDHVFVSNTHPIDPEPNNTAQTAINLGNLSQPALAYGMFESNYVYDWYSFQGQAGDSLNVAVRGASDGAGTCSQVYVSLQGPSGQGLGQYSNATTWQLTETGNYSLSLYCYYGGSYELAVSVNSPLPSPQPFKGLSEFDVSDPAHPVLLSTANIGRLAQGIATDGEMAYVTLSDPGMLQAWDFSDVANPVECGSAQVDQAGDLSVSGNLATIVSNVPGRQFWTGAAYVTIPESGKVQVVDVSDPQRPVALESYETGRTIDGLAAQGMLNFFAADSLYALSIRPAGVESADLAVTQLTTPPAVALGSTLEVGWTVRNLGRSAAEGTWTDAIYLSADASLDADDVFLGEVSHTGPLATLATYSAALAPVIRDVAPGYYYLIAAADSGDDVNEWYVEANNLRSSSQPIYVGYPDLAVTHVGVPEVVNRGDPLPVEWTVFDRDLAPAGGTWTDQVYLSSDETLDAGDTLVGSLPHAGGLSQRQVYHAGLDVDTASLPDAIYYVIVKADAGAVVDEDGREDNNYRVSSTFRLGVPALTLGQPLTETFDFSRQYKYYRVSVEAGQHLFVSLNDLNDIGSNELYVKYGSAPTRSDYDAKYSTNLAADQQVEIPSTQAGAYYILAYAAGAPDAPAEFTLTSAILDFQIRGISPGYGGNTGNVTVTVRGANFPDDVAVSLVSPAGLEVTPSKVYRGQQDVVYATFNLSGIPTGAYDIRAASAITSTVIPDIFIVSAGQGPNVQATIEAPSAVRVGQEGVVWVRYTNTGDTDAPAPLLSVTTDVGGLRLSWEDSYAASVQRLGIGQGLAGILPPGASGSFPVYFFSNSTGAANFSLGMASDFSAAIDWSAIKDDVRPASIAPDAWDAIWSNFTASVGGTLGSYLAVLDDNANYLSQFGQYVDEAMWVRFSLSVGGPSFASGTFGHDGAEAYDVSKLLAFEIQQAGASLPRPTLTGAVDVSDAAPGLPLVFSRAFLQPISGRYALDSLGRGWTHNWDISLATDADQNVTIDASGGTRAFRKLSTGGYFGSPGDYAALTLDQGLYRLVETDGTAYSFRADGRLDYVQDTNGNRIACVYTGDRLTGLVHSNGDSLTLAYNAQGRITSVMDPAGRATTYAYDASGEHLTSVTGADGTTVYTYSAATSGPAAHAIVSIAYPGGTHDYFDYDAQGRLTREYRDGGAEAVSYAYDTANGLYVTDAAGATTTMFYNDSGQVAQTHDALGRITRFTYDTNHNLTRLSAPSGVTYSYRYDGRGNLTSQIDSLGNCVSMAYDPTLNRLLAVRDARGNTTRYTYDSQGDMTAITYPNGSAEHFAYDPLGDLIESTNRRGQAIDYAYNGDGLLTRKTYADSTHVDYTYDARGNMLTATDATGTTAMVYDSADRMTKITYTSGQWLSYTYDAGGRRASMTTFDGFVTNYHYDSAGRLSSLTDGTGATIDMYTYDAVGRLVREDKGNGTYTTYQYDAAGQLLHLVNCASNGSVNSRFDYTYDSLGRRTSEGTSYGLWTYQYDATGQLTHAVLDSTDPSTPDQDLTYVYDAAGNRIRTIANGVTTEYAANNMNQYTTVGTAAYSYDVDGNLISRIDGADGWTYSYNDENRLAQVIGAGSTWTYSYDVLGNRVASMVDGATTNYLTDPRGMGKVVAEYDGTSNLVARYGYGLGLTSRVDASGNGAFYTFSAMGNVSELIGSMGTDVLNAYSYDPFGSLLAKTEAVSSPFDFAGKYGVMSESNGLTLMRARVYASNIARFTSEDPLGIVGGDCNLYRYSGNASTGGVDPLGLWSAPYEVADKIDGWIDRVHQVGSERFGGQHWVIQGSMDTARDVVKVLSPHDVLRLGTGSVVDNVKRLANVALMGIGALKFASKGAARLRYGGEWSLTRWWKQYDVLAKLWHPTRDLIVRVTEGLWTVKDLWDLWQSKTNVVASFDPNDKVGPAGAGVGHYIVADTAMPYAIYYENDPELGATAPAQVVRIEDTFDADLDLMTFELGDVNLYGDFWVDVPDGLQYYETLVDLRPEGNNLLVRVTAGLDSDTRKVTWLFESLDPDTMEAPDDAMAGFLPVNDEDLHNGEGHLGYTIRPLAGLASGTQITNQAFNFFDTNEAVPTPTTLNTIDAGKPTSAVQALAVQLPDEPFTVTWAGQDDANGSGVGSYTVYVSDNGGEWQVWQQDTADTSAQFIGVGGHSYAFRSVARDNVGYVEDDPGAIEAATTLDFSQLRVDRLETTPSGFVVRFRRSLDVSTLNLYDVQAGTYGPADLTVVGATVGPVAGSLLYDEQARTVTFIKTGGPLAADTYTVTLRSGADAFKDGEGHLLDGDANNVEGGDYVNTVTVEAGTARMLSLPDFTRGPGQAVNVPATGAGIPVSIDNGDGILGIDFVLEYDPTMLTVTGVTLASGMPAGWSVERDLGTPGRVAVWVFGQTPLAADARDLVRVSAAIPNGAPYSSAGPIRLENLSINEGAISSATDSAVQVVAYLGDATGNHAYSALDAAYLARVGVGLDGGFASYRMKDPVLLADTTGNGGLSSLDASYLARKGVGLSQPEIPNLPGVLPAIVEGGPDPLMSVPNLTAVPGGRVSVPVLLGDATGLQAADICLRYDTSLLDLTNADVSLGTLTPGWTLTTNVDDAAGEVRLWVYSTNILAGGSGSLVELNFQVSAGALPGQALLDLADTSSLNEGHLVLTLQDGQVTVRSMTMVPYALTDKALYYKDADGTDVTVTLKGGSAIFTFLGEATYTVNKKGITVVGTGLELEEVALTQSDDKTKLTFKTKGGTVPGATVGRITSDDPLGQVDASTIDLVGGGVLMTGAGYIGTLQVEDVRDGADLVMPGAGATKGIGITCGQMIGVDLNVGSWLKNLNVLGYLDQSTLTATGQDARSGVSINSLKAGRVGTASVTASGGINSITVSDWQSGTITAGWIGSLTTSVNTKTGSQGHFGADVTLTGAALPAKKAALGSVKVAGDLLNGTTWDVQAGFVGSLTFAGTVDHSVIRSAGDITSLKMGASNGSDYGAGVSFNLLQADRHVQQGDTANAPTGTIKTLTVTGWKIPRNQPIPRFFVDSHISARIGTLNLLNWDGLGGLFAPAGKVKSVKHTDTVDKLNSWAYPAPPRQVSSEPGEFIHIV